MRFLFIVIIHISITTKVISQEIINSYTFGGSQWDEVHALRIDSEGNKLIAGHSTSSDDIFSNHKKWQDGFLMKIAPSGKLQWNSTFGGYGGDFIEDMIISDDGNYILCGWSSSFPKENSIDQMYVVKIDQSGEILWEQTFGGNDGIGHTYGSSLIEINDGSIFIVGYSNRTSEVISQNYGKDDIILLKLDSNGNHLWGKNYGGSNLDQGKSIAHDTDFIYIAGRTESSDFDITNNYGKSDSWLVKIDFDGKLIWSKNIGGSDFDRSVSVTLNKDKLYLLGDTKSKDGSIKTNDQNREGLHLVTLDLDGNEVWQYTNGGDYSDHGISLVVDDEILIYGISYSFPSFLTNKGDIWLLKLDLSGNEVWSNTFGGSRPDGSFNCSSCISNKRETISFAGSVYSTDGDIKLNKGQQDIWVVELKRN